MWCLVPGSDRFWGRQRVPVAPLPGASSALGLFCWPQPGLQDKQIAAKLRSESDFPIPTLYRLRAQFTSGEVLYGAMRLGRSGAHVKQQYSIHLFVAIVPGFSPICIMMGAAIQWEAQGKARSQRH